MSHFVTLKLVAKMQSECGRKVRHIDRESAMRAIRQVNAKNKIIGSVEPYPCDVCGGWHWGKSPWSCA